jgi:hypothetical protein
MQPHFVVAISSQLYYGFEIQASRQSWRPAGIACEGGRAAGSDEGEGPLGAMWTPVGERQ